MASGLYAVNPMSELPTYYTAESIEAAGLNRTTLVADLASATLASMASRHFAVRVCEQAVTPVDCGTPAEIVAITRQDHPAQEHDRDRAPLPRARHPDLPAPGLCRPLAGRLSSAPCGPRQPGIP
jgi:hypothetical protein